MVEWVVLFEENGPEYTGVMIIVAESVTRLDKQSILADGVKITLDEDILEIHKNIIDKKKESEDDG